MIKIRALGTRELKQVLSLLKQYAPEEFERSTLRRLKELYIPLNLISQMLPPQWQFVPGIYMAESRGQVMGLIWLTQDGAKSNRWRIDELIIDPAQSMYDIGTQLVNYVINRYGGGGVQTFIAYVDQYQEDALALLKSCGFRRCTRLHTFEHKKLSELALKTDAGGLKGLRESVRGDAARLKALHSDALPVEVRTSLDRNVRDFVGKSVGRATDGRKKVFFKRWVVDDPVSESLIATVDIVSDNYQDFRLGILVHPGWGDNAEVLLHYGLQQVLSITKNAHVEMDVYDFDKPTLGFLEALGFARTGIMEVLVKDYWIRLEEDDRHKARSPLLLFSGKTSPAVNFKP